MPRRRIVCERAIAPVIERLEGRTLLTTIVGGGTDPVTGEPIATTVFYGDAEGNLVRIDVGGDTTAEFIGGRVVGGTVILNPLAPPTTDSDEGYNLFSIYVSESNRFSYISVTPIDEDTGDLLPFDGDSGQLRIRNATTGQSVQVTPSGPGALLLGAKTDLPSPADNIPILSRRASGPIGVRPASRTVPAGFFVAPGNDFGKFLFAGTVLGTVDIGGSIESFYAGNVLTGDARGLPAGTSNTVRGGKRVSNFTVGGNLHSLTVGGSVGTDELGDLDRPNYNTGFDMRVGGTIGQLAVRDAWLGGVDVIHGRVTSEFGVNVAEVEGRNILSGQVGTADETAGWASGFLEGDALAYNNTFDQPQILNSFLGRRGRSTVVATGQLVADPFVQDYVDYYGMPLLAGQDLTLTLRPTGTVAGLSNMVLGVFDPDGRLILTDYANVDQTAVNGQPIHFTADRPGLYRFAVGVFGTADFSNAGAPIGASPYTLTVNGGGDLALGGVIATNQISDGKAGGYGFFVQNGDMGSLQAGSNIFSLTDQTVNVRKGNLRSIEGGDIGVLLNNALTADVNLAVTRGNVGLLRSTAGILSMNQTALVLPIGGDYQVVSAATRLGAALIANRGIGVIRAGAVDTEPLTSVFTVNADQLGNDGIIDLIDVAGDFGTLGAGGPPITTGPGGNVRYMQVGGTVYRDIFFGGGEQEETVYDAGQRIRIFDDSGTEFDIEPASRPNPFFVPGGTNPATIGTQVSVIGYGVRDKGGLILASVRADGNVRIGAGAERGSRAHAEIGVIEINAPAQENPVIVDPVTNQLVLQFPTGGVVGNTNARSLDLLLDGSATVDVFRVVGQNMTSITNETVGEILNVDMRGAGTGGAAVGTLGTLVGTNIGVGVNHTGAAVNGIQTIAANVYPYNQQHNGIITGNIIAVDASGAVGNLNVTGNIGTVTANSGGRNDPGVFEGIAGPIVATNRIDRVNIGEGILPSGSGNFSRAGVYGGIVGQVRGSRADIRGDVVGTSNVASVALSNGSIVGSRIFVTSAFSMAAKTATSRTFVDFNDTVDNPSFELGEVSVSGSGGIIGSWIGGADVGPISVRRGFGILSSRISVLGAGTVASINAEGYGIRGSEINGGANLAALSASAKARNVSTVEYSPSVRLSEQFDIDPFFDQAPNRETDLHLFLGTSARRPQIKRVTDTGIIADTLATGSRNAGTITANQIRASQFNFSNQISRIRTTDVIDGLRITTGRLRNFTSGSSAFGLDFSIAGPIDDLRVVGDVDDASSVRALGPTGRITNFIVDGTMNGDVTSENTFSLLAIGKDLGPPALVRAAELEEQRIRGDVLGTIQVG